MNRHFIAKVKKEPKLVSFAILFPRNIWVFDYKTNRPIGFREHKGSVELTILALEFASSLGAFFWRMPYVGEQEPDISSKSPPDKTGLQS